MQQCRMGAVGREAQGAGGEKGNRREKFEG